MALKNDEKWFSLYVKSSFFLKIFKLLSRFFSHRGKQLDKEAKVNFKISETRKQTITIYILPNISRSKGNQTMKFCQLIEYNMRNIFLENS